MNRVVIVCGKRTPYIRANTLFNDVKGHELLRHALEATVNSINNIKKKDVQYVVAGQVFQKAINSNVARDAVILADFDVSKTAAHSVTMACISANQAITSVANLIATNQIDCGIGGGVETLSEFPMYLPSQLRNWVMSRTKTKTAFQRLANALKLRPSMVYGVNLLPVAEFTTNETMGYCCDKLTRDFKVTREAQDKFGLRSHEMADKAQKAGLLTDVAPITVPNVGIVDKDNGIRLSTLERVSKLRPAFTKTGTATASNSSFMTDGASATLLMSESKAVESGLKPKAVIKDYCYSALDPKEYLLLGPAHATTQLLQRNNLTIKDIDVYEYHEAFSGQVLANLAAMDSEEYCQKKMGTKRMGLIPMEKLNSWGGSVSLGHPFGSTGSRIVNMATNRLLHSGGKYALVSACAGGALGHAMLIENIS